jgi:hypothetical protein
MPALTVDDYLAALPEDRRTAIAEVRNLVLQNLASGFEEGIQYGMIGYYVPHQLYPAGYHCDPKQPVPFLGIASQKNYMSIYLMGLYVQGDQDRFREAWLATGKKLDMGKACIRFKKLDQLALEVLADTIRGITVEDFLTAYVGGLQKSK